MAVTKLLASFSWTGYPIAYRFEDGIRCWRCASRQSVPPSHADNVFGASVRCRDCQATILSVEATRAEKHADW